jgi:hypothetical protein
MLIKEKKEKIGQKYPYSYYLIYLSKKISTDALRTPPPRCALWSPVCTTLVPPPLRQLVPSSPSCRRALLPHVLADGEDHIDLGFPGRHSAPHHTMNSDDESDQAADSITGAFVDEQVYTPLICLHLSIQFKLSCSTANNSLDW